MKNKDASHKGDETDYTRNLWQYIYKIKSGDKRSL